MKNREIEERLKLAEQYKQEALYGIVKGQEFYIDGYNSAKKEIKKKLKDEYNKYNSWLQQETQFKIGKGNPNLIRETELRAKVELLKSLIDED